MAEIETPKVPPPPRGRPRDDSIGTLLKLVGGCCVTFCTCVFGIVFLFMGALFGMYAGLIIVIAVVCIGIGCVSAKYTWNSIQEASGSN
ncbi:MAG: hypothetical protein ACTSWA_02965 [Candidatus Thorarchaeota archaeon]